MIRIVLVDDHRLFRDGLRAILSAHPGFTVVAEAETAREAFKRIQEVEHDLVILDLTLPGSNGTALLRDLNRLRGHHRPVLVLTMHQHADIVSDALAAGATSYALKLQSEADLIKAIETTARGERYLAPQIAAVAADMMKRPRRGAGVLALLSSREREIFDLLIRGGTNADVARQLFISVKTVETHRTRIMRKLGVHSIGELIRLAARHGLLGS
jgi:DNA-binding NarL/FixJ family response regulator